MNLLIQAVTDPGILILFNDDRSIRASYLLSLSLKESKNLLSEIEIFLSSENMGIKDISEIVVVNGPGSFTGIRSIVLIVNTLAFVYSDLGITSISYFDLFSEYPIIKQSSKRDAFIQLKKEEEVQILSFDEANDLFEKENITTVYGDTSFSFGTISLENIIDYATLCKEIAFSSQKRIEPLYIKKPNIF